MLSRIVANIAVGEIGTLSKINLWDSQIWERTMIIILYGVMPLIWQYQISGQKSLLDIRYWGGWSKESKDYILPDFFFSGTREQRVIKWVTDIQAHRAYWWIEYCRHKSKEETTMRNAMSNQSVVHISLDGSKGQRLEELPTCSWGVSQILGCN